MIRKTATEAPYCPLLHSLTHLLRSVEQMSQCSNSAAFLDASGATARLAGGRVLISTANTRVVANSSDLSAAFVCPCLHELEHHHSGSDLLFAYSL